jgi:two-component system sensor histidine kinase VanS
MINRIRGSLSAKIFIGIALILLAVSLLMFGLLRIFMPKTYENEMVAGMTANAVTLAKQLEAAPETEWENRLTQFCLINNAGAAIYDESGAQIAGVGVFIYGDADEGVTQIGGNTAASYSQAFKSDDKTYILATYANTESVEQVTGIFAKIFPFVLLVIIAVSILTAYLYSHFLAKPIVDISNVSKKLTSLNMSWRCDVSRTDEIGTLAVNLNEMAIRLDLAMKELQTVNTKLQGDIEREREQERRRRDFFTAISHELKTPVTILKGEIEGMMLNVGKFKDRDKYLQEAHKTTESIEKLVREIMTLVKLDTIHLKTETVKLSDLVSDCLHQYASLAQDKHIEIESSLEDSVTVGADQEQMRTVLSNIIGNAVKHSPEGGHVDISVSELYGFVELSVVNSGVHIPPDELRQVWEPFYRTDKSRSRDTGGSGLGLYIVKTILDLHKFAYRFENTDSGMVFKIIF